MKKPPALLKIFITAGFLLFFLFNVGSLRCEPPPAGSHNLQPQANRSGIALDKARDQSWLGDQEDKSERFKELEWLIKQSLLMKYQRMEIQEGLEDLPD
jgi:hypothetical protein